MRVFFTGAFRKPRELSWLLGVTLLIAGIGAGFTGYSLPDDLLSGTGLRIIYSAMLSIPFVGTWLAYLFFGGEFPAPELIPRLFVMHILLIPATITACSSAHLALVWHQTHTQYRPKGTPEETVTGTPVWPKFALKSVGLAFMTFAVLAGLGGLVQINPVWLYGPFVPYSAPSPAQPDFYAGWLEGLLRLWPNWEFHVFGHTIPELFLPSVVVPGIIFTALAAWPFLEARAKRDTAIHHDAQRPRDEPVRSGVGAAAIAFFVLLMLAGSNDVLAKYLQVEVDTLNGVLKVLLFVVPVVAGLLTWWICRDLRARGTAPIAHPMRIEFRRNAAGGFDESHDGPGHEAPVPDPQPPGGDGALTPDREEPWRSPTIGGARGVVRAARWRLLVVVRHARRGVGAGSGDLRPVADLLLGGDRRRRDRVRTDRMVAAAVPAPAPRGSRRAREAVPREPAARDRRTPRSPC